MREVLQGLERLGIRYFVTGSEALGRYGQPRQSMDIDVVLDIDATQFGPVAAEFEEEYLIAEPVDFQGRWMAALVSMTELGKVDLILRRDDPFGRSAMERRERWSHPQYGDLWVTTLEDLLLAKLEWSDGTSELQLRDCRNLVVVNRGTIDWSYVDLWSHRLGVSDTLEAVRVAP